MSPRSALSLAVEELHEAWEAFSTDPCEETSARITYALETAHLAVADADSIARLWAKSLVPPPIPKEDSDA